MLNWKGRITALLLAGILFLSTSCAAPTGGDSAPPTPAPVPEDGMRGIWVSSVYNLDYPSAGTTAPEKLKAEADKILKGAADMGMNAVFLQVRPSCDALYPSSLFPWSRYLTGNQSAAPKKGFDPLQYWVEQAHALGLELHAWLNPYRVTKGGAEELAALSPDSPALRHPEWLVEYKENYYLDPGIPEVRDLVVQGAEELVRNYDVDGVHLDDYFYPGKEFDDAATYQTYGQGFSDLGDWRRDNVNKLIQALDTSLHSLDPELSFGVSPSGVWRDKRNDPKGSNSTGGYESYVASYADSRKWVKEGWVDYICPQVYWYIGHKTMDYKTIVRWWADTVAGTGVKLYIGMADYQAAQAKEGDPWYGTAALRAQLELNAATPGVSGEVHFRYQLMARSESITGLYKEWYLGKKTAGGQGAVDAETAAFLAKLPLSEQKHWAAPYYGKLGAMGIVTGLPDGTYAPEEPVSRAAMCKLVFSSMQYLNGEILAKHIYDNPFSDTAGHWAEPVIVPLCTAGYLDTADYPGGFSPDGTMTRAEVAKLLVRALGYTDDGTMTQPPFPDVTQDVYYVAKAKELGIVTGKDDGNFGPGESIQRATAAVMLLRAMELKK